jgi:hypothetical protein
MSFVVKRILSFVMVFLALAAPAAAQVKTGESSLSLNGNLSAGYSDDYSNLLGSDHSVFGAGNADLSGYYYNPNFLSFDVQPFYNQSRLNSSYQSLTAASGVSASTQVFGGSKFPGSVSYSSVYNSSGNFSVPGLPNYTTNGDTETLAVNWGVHLDDLPSLNLSFSDSNNSYSVYGTDSRGKFHGDTFSARSAYKIAGFTLSGGYQYAGTDILTPDFLTSESSTLQSDSVTNSFFFGVGHNLPWNGSISASATRLDLTANYGASGSTDNYNASIDTLSAAASIAPANHLNLGATSYYTDNLEGTLYSTLVAAGALVPETPAQSSHSLSLTGYGNYDIPSLHMVAHGLVERQQQTFWGESFASDTINGTVTYSNRLWDGPFTGVLGLTRTTVDLNHESMLGVNTSINYSHNVKQWSLSGGLSYAQNAQTLLIAYTSSGYNYNGSVGRRFRRRCYWSAYASGARSLLTDVPGSANTSQSYSTALSLPRISFNGSFSESKGNALLTATGLTATPIPITAVSPASVVYFNGKSYAAGIGAHPTRHLTMTASFAKGLSGTNSNSTLSNNSTENMYFQLSYQLRKLNFDAGYSRLTQGFSGTGIPSALLGTYYVGISRYFNFF